MGTVIAVSEDSYGRYFGFEIDSEFLGCVPCDQRGKVTTYRLRYTEDESRNLHHPRATAQLAIEAEHPNHSDKIRVW